MTPREKGRVFKLVKGQNGTTSFLPSKEKTGGEVNYIKNKEAMCLTENQTDNVYKAVEEGNIINTTTTMYETMQNQDDNPYKIVLLNKVFREEDKFPEMRNWSIFSDNVRYIQHEQMTPQTFNIDPLDYRHHNKLYLKLKGEERETLDVDFGVYPDVLKSKYLDVYEGVYAEMVYANKFNENSDLSMTYLGQIKMMRDTKVKAEERFPITDQGFTSGKLLDGTECQILTQVLQNPTCQNLTICDAKLYMHYQYSPPILREFKWEMDNMSVYFS